MSDLNDKILKTASKICFMHGSVAGDRTCQDWSDREFMPDKYFTEDEKAELRKSYEEYNSDGSDFDPENISLTDEMMVSFIVGHALTSIRTELAQVKKERDGHKARADRLADGILFSPEEFMTLATFAMVNDQPEHTDDIDIDTLHSVLDQIAIRSLGCNDWIEAYHKF